MPQLNLSWEDGEESWMEGSALHLVFSHGKRREKKGEFQRGMEEKIGTKDAARCLKPHLLLNIGWQQELNCSSLSLEMGSPVLIA